MVRQSAIETLVWLAVVEQIADAVYRVFEDRSGGKDDHSDLWINKGNDVESRYEAGDLSSEAEVFECVHDNLGICQRAKYGRNQRCGVRISASQFSRLVIQRISLIYERFLKNFLVSAAKT